MDNPCNCKFATEQYNTLKNREYVRLKYIIFKQDLAQGIQFTLEVLFRAKDMISIEIDQKTKLTDNE